MTLTLSPIPPATAAPALTATPTHADPDASAPKYEVVDTLPKFGKDRKPVRQLHAVPEWGLLISLVGACVGCVWCVCGGDGRSGLGRARGCW